MIKKTASAVLCSAMLLTLAACGDAPGERALSGAGIGAGGGALGAAVLGANPLAGAAIGGAVGAVTGAATNKRDINLGKPAWK